MRTIKNFYNKPSQNKFLYFFPRFFQCMSWCRGFFWGMVSDFPSACVGVSLVAIFWPQFTIFLHLLWALMNSLDATPFIHNPPPPTISQPPMPTRPWSHLWGNRAQVVNNRRGKRMETKTAISEHFSAASLTSVAAGNCGKIREKLEKSIRRWGRQKPQECKPMTYRKESHRNPLVL